MLRKRDLAVSRIVIIGMSIAWKMAKLSFTDVDGKGFSMVGKTNGSIPNGERPPGPLTILICRIGCTSIYRNEKKGASVIGRPFLFRVFQQFIVISEKVVAHIDPFPNHTVSQFRQAGADIDQPLCHPEFQFLHYNTPP